MNEAPPFGAFAPSAAEERARRVAHRLPANYFGRKGASLLLGPAGGRSRRAFDVDVFGGARARLHPYDNISEKRVYMSPQLWDAEERRLLGSAIGASSDESFYFVDVGANAGLYTLFVDAAAKRAGKAASALCIEPDAEMRRRLSFNLAASNIGAVVAPVAAGAEDGVLRFAPNEKSRGMSRLHASGAVSVEARTLHRLLLEWSPPRVDALKIDIEGAELGVLRAFFGASSVALAPRFLIAEVSHEAEEGALAALLRANSYAVESVSERNIVARAAARSQSA